LKNAAINKINRLARQAHVVNFFKLFSSLFLGQGLAFLLSPVLSRLYSPDDFGLVALYLAVAGIMSLIATGKYEQAIMLPKKEVEAVSLMALVGFLSVIFAVISLVIIVFFHSKLVLLSDNPSLAPWLYFLPLSVLIHAIYQSFTYYANRRKLFGHMARVTLIQYILLNVSRVGIGFSPVTINGLIVAQILAPAVALYYLIKKILPEIKPYFTNISLSLISQQSRIYLQYPSYNLIQSLTNTIAGSLPIFMFASGFSSAVVGLYAFGYSFVFRPISLFSQSALQVLSQKIIEDYHHKKAIYPSLKKLVGRLIMIAIVPLGLLASFAPTIFSVVFSSEWEMSGTIMQILTPWLFAVFLASPLSFLPELFFQQKKAMILDLISLFLRFAALSVGIHFESLMISLALFSGVSCLMVLYFLLWYLRMAKKWDSALAESSNHQ
jgi:O-antigen/teichoic acid export membrane protein